VVGTQLGMGETSYRSLGHEVGAPGAETRDGMREVASRSQRCK